MSTPVVIQGTAVPKPQDNPPFSSAMYDNDGGALQRSDKQETGCNDPIFAALFYVCFIAMCAVAALYSPKVFEDGEDGEDVDFEPTAELKGYMFVTAIIILLSFIFSALGMSVLMCIPQFLIKLSLLFVTALGGVIALISLASGNIVGGIFGVIFFFIGICYARAVWSRIPFATINLIAAFTAIKKHCTIVVFAYMFAVLAGAWTMIVALATVGLIDKIHTCDEVTKVCTDPNYGILFALFLAFFFGEQVFQNCIHVCIAGTVGTWWFEADDASVGCCDSAVFSSFVRTMTTSFGSICFGSFLVAILEALKALANAAQSEGDGGFLVCIAECILACLASLLEYFNRWAFIYVGLYGMPYMKAGKSVMELFQSRGWEAVIADDLIGNTLFLVSLVVGLIVGLVAFIIQRNSDFFDGIGEGAGIAAFFIGFIAGFVISSILMGTIASSVNAIIVLFAECPSEFQQNHPELSTKMLAIWNEVYPGSV